MTKRTTLRRTTIIALGLAGLLSACGGQGGGGGVGQSVTAWKARADEAVTGWTNSAGQSIASANQSAGRAFDNAGRAIDSKLGQKPSTAAAQ